MSDMHRVQERPNFRRGLARMSGRDPQEQHRAATPLELLFDLSFVVAFGQAADQLAHFVAADHVVAGIGGFGFAMFAICWAWINFTGFASAYDTDDWFYRLTTMVQMIGVIVLALGLPAVFDSFEEGGVFDNRIVVAGYVIMRTAMVVQWLRAARQDPSRRRTALTFALFIGVAQVGWVVMAILDAPLSVALLVFPLLYLVEIIGPIIAERKSSGTPWHAHHLAERYGLLVIIALGEGVFGTVASVGALVEKQGWSSEAVLVVVAGVGLTFALWWHYFGVPAGPVLERFRERRTVWSYSHILLFASIAAIGAGLHVAAFVSTGESDIGTLGAIVAVVAPVLCYSILVFVLYSYMVREADPFHVLLFAGTIVMLALAIVLAATGASLGLCLIIVTIAPAINVVGYETIGYRHQAARMARLQG